MFKTSMEVAELKRRLEDKDEEIKRLRFLLEDSRRDRSFLEKDCESKLDLLTREIDMKVEEARNELRKEMQKSLIESDLKRVEAEAKLETYEKMDTKEERQQIQKMLTEAIKGLSNQKVNVVK